MDVCTAANRIGTYTPATNSVEISLLSKNVDAVTVEANLVACDALTIQGVPVTTTSSDKIQNISSATAGVTNFTGEVTMTDLSTDQIETDTIIPKTGNTLQITDAGITSPLMHFDPTTGRVGINTNNPQQALDVRANSTQASPSFCVDAANSRIGVGVINPTYAIHLNSSATTTTNLMALLQSALPVSAYSQIFFGKDTGKNMSLRYTTSSTDTAASNYGGIYISGTETSRWYQSSVEMRVPMTLTSTLSCPSTSIKSGSITTGAATFNVSSASFSGFNSYIIRWSNLGCSGNFTPYLRFGKTSTAYTSGYRAFSEAASNSEMVTGYISLNAYSSGLQNSELMTGELRVRRSGTTVWLFNGFSTSSNFLLNWTISGSFTDAAAGIDLLVFGVTGGTLNSATATYEFIPNPGY